MNPQAEEKVGFKAPIVMGVLGFFVLLFFGFLGKEGSVEFQLSRRQDVIQLDPIVVDGVTLGIGAGALLLLFAAFSTFRAVRSLKTPIWVSSVYGLIGVIALLGWLAVMVQPLCTMKLK